MDTKPDVNNQMPSKNKQVSQYARSIIEASLDPLVIICNEGKISDINEASVKITGVAREQMIETEFSNYFVEPAKALQGFDQVFDKGFVSDYPLTILQKNGKLINVLYNASVFKDEIGNVVGAIIVIRDDPEQKANELIIANKELAFQDKEKGKRAAELIIANKELFYQNDEKEKRADELKIANKELIYQNEEKEKRADELIIANKELVFQNDEKEKRANELIIANKELIFQNDEKEKRAAELIIANRELSFQNDEKEKRAAELIVANKELAFQNDEKEKRAAELIIANKELLYQNDEKEKRADELIIADIELEFQNKEKEKRAIANKELEAISKSLKQASQYSRSLIEASLDPLLTISPEGKITDVNEASVKVTGVSREELIGTDFSDYFTEPEKAREGYKKVFDLGFVSDYPLTIHHINGKLIDVLYNASVYKDDNGNVLGAFAAARDITLQKAAEEKIRQSEKMFKSIFDNSLAAIVVTDDQGNYLSANKAAGEVLGYTVKELLQMNVGDLKTIVQHGAAERFEEYLNKGEEAGEFNFISDNGVNKFVQYRAIRTEPDFNLSIMMDITDQKQASQYSRSLLEASLDPLLTISLEGKITDVNEASVKVTGVSREELIGTDFSDYFTEPEKAREGYKKVFDLGFVSDYPLTIHHENGKLTDVLYNASVYKDDKGNVLGVFAAARDVTAQNKLERDVAERKKELERLVELERFRRLTVGRELKMIELKKENQELREKLGIAKDETIDYGK